MALFPRMLVSQISAFDAIEQLSESTASPRHIHTHRRSFTSSSPCSAPSLIAFVAQNAFGLTSSEGEAPVKKLAKETELTMVGLPQLYYCVCVRCCIPIAEQSFSRSAVLSPASATPDMTGVVLHKVYAEVPMAALCTMCSQSEAEPCALHTDAYLITYMP